MSARGASNARKHESMLSAYPSHLSDAADDAGFSKFRQQSLVGVLHETAALELSTVASLPTRKMDTTTNSSVTSPEKLLGRKNKAASEQKPTDKSIAEASHLDFDEIDGLRAKADFNWLDMTCVIVSICSYLIDLAADGFMAATYYNMGHYWYFGFTLAFVVVPALTMTGLSAKWYIKDQKNQHFPPVSKCTWAFRIFCLIFFLSPVARYKNITCFKINLPNMQVPGMLTRSIMASRAGEQRRRRTTRRQLSFMPAWHMKTLTPHSSGSLSASWSLHHSWCSSFTSWQREP